MNITSATANNLGEKLAGLNLTDEEGVLLATLLAGGAESESEVEGFGKPNGPENTPSSGYTEVEWTYVKSVMDPLPSLWKQPRGDGWIIIES